jgi:DNA-3-methyladenine glycosylase I
MMHMMKNVNRCAWVTEDPLYIAYHDHEWAVPVRDDQSLFELLTLEGAQAGLSWITILKRRENYRDCFDRFDPYKVAAYDDKKISQLLINPGIIRNRLKIHSTVTNARAFIQVQKEFGSFADYLWNFVDGKSIQNHWKTLQEVPASTSLSDRLSKDLKRRSFRFAGSTICYAFMQAVGLVNDHTRDCYLGTVAN